jgi:hypothetical protein
MFSNTGSVFSSSTLPSFLLESIPVYFAVCLINLISVAVIRFLFFVFIRQFSLPYWSVGTAGVL